MKSETGGKQDNKEVFFGAFREPAWLNLPFDRHHNDHTHLTDPGKYAVQARRNQKFVTYLATGTPEFAFRPHQGPLTHLASQSF